MEYDFIDGSVFRLRYRVGDGIGNGFTDAAAIACYDDDFVADIFHCFLPEFAGILATGFIRK